MKKKQYIRILEREVKRLKKKQKSPAIASSSNSGKVCVGISGNWKYTIPEFRKLAKLQPSEGISIGGTYHIDDFAITVLYIDWAKNEVISQYG